MTDLVTLFLEGGQMFTVFLFLLLYFLDQAFGPILSGIFVVSLFFSLPLIFDKEKRRRPKAIGTAVVVVLFAGWAGLACVGVICNFLGKCISFAKAVKKGYARNREVVDATVFAVLLLSAFYAAQSIENAEQKLVVTQITFAIAFAVFLAGFTVRKNGSN